MLSAAIRSYIASFFVWVGAIAPVQATAISVGIYNNEPEVFLTEAGEPAGFWVELVDVIAEAEDWQINYVLCEWNDCLQDLENGQLDLMVDVAYSSERDRRFDFNQEIVLSSWSVVYGRPNVTINSIIDLDQRRVGVLEGSIQHAALAKRSATFGIQPEFVAAPDFESLLRMLHQGEVDAGVLGRFTGQQAESEYNISQTNVLVHPSQQHFATAEGRNGELLAAIDRNLEALLSEERSAYYQAQQRWLQPPPPRLGKTLGHFLLDSLIFLPAAGLFIVALWNRALRYEVKKRLQAEQRIQTLANNSPGVIFQYRLQEDGSEALIYASSRFFEVMGIDAETVMKDASRWWKLAYAEDLPNLRGAFFQSARALTPWNSEWQIETPDGQRKCLQVSANPQREENGDTVWDGFIFDITERKDAEIALRKSESRFQHLAHNVPGIIYGYRLRPDGTDEFTYLSTGFEDVYGFPPDGVLKDPQVVWKMVHPDDVEKVRRSVTESYQTMQVWRTQYRAVLPDGRLKWLEGVARPSQQPNGDVIWDGLVIDITDRKEIEETLRKTEQRFRNIAANVPGAIFQYVQLPDGTDRIDYMSPGCYDLWEVPAELAEKNCQILWDIVHPDDIDAMYASVQRSAQRLEPWYCQWRTRPPSGKTKWLEAAGRPELQPNGDIVWDSVVIDISDRKQAEIALKVSESRLATLIGNLPGFVYRTVNNRDYTAEYVSQGVYDITGYSPSDYLEYGITSLGAQTHPHDRARVWNVVQRALQRRQAFECEYRMMTRSGEIKWVWERGQGIFDDEDNLHHLEGFVTDISDRKHTELALQESEVRYRQVVEAQTDFILRSLPDTTITFANDALCRALGFMPQEVVGKKWSEFVNAEDLEQNAFRQIALLTPKNPRCFVENRDTRANGQTGWTQWLNEGIFDEAGQLVEIQSVGRDITDLKQVEQALRTSEEHLRLVTENMSDLVCLHHVDGHFTYATPSSQTLIGYSPEELIGRDPYDFIHPDDQPLVRSKIHDSALRGQASGGTYRMRHRNGHYIWLETLAKPVLDDAGKILHFQTTSRNVSDRVKAEEQLKYDALHDGLTRLPNRNLLMHRLDAAIQRTQHNPDFQFAVLFLDLDNFKVVNDSLGHLVGDKLLITVADLLRQLIRETDVAARLGGDEFVILIEEVDGIHEAVMIAERILAALRSPFSITDREVFIGTSIGIVAGCPNYQQAVDLLRDADLAMYRAKQRGRSQYALFDPTMHLQVMQRLHLEQDLRQAIERGELLLCYQPIVALDTLDIVGFEALIRWEHPKRGLISPKEFMPISEETGLIIPMGKWILQQACHQLKQWQTRYPSRQIKVSVNLSVQQLRPSLLTELEETLTACNVLPGSLVIEITESMLVQNIEATQHLLEQLRNLQIRLSIDDFGTGYSSLSYLSRLPVDNLKIDRTFVSPQQADTRNQVIAESIVALSNLLELTVIAEGIETLEQLEWLRKLGCKEGQGYLFAPPVSSEEAARMLQLKVLTPS